ncbi:MAG TPA: ABC transporter permease [Chloroflexia bacterium]|nr:ABC transporter permease [Chloroflexia bacterium]
MNTAIAQRPGTQAAPSRVATLAPTGQFTLAVLRAGVRNRVALATALFTPLFMLAIFWLTTQGGKPGGFNMLSFIFPGIVSFTVMMAGSTQVTRLGSWRQQGVFGRLACTPVPLGQLVLAAALAQVLLSLVQALIVVVFGILVVGIPVQPLGIPLAAGVLTLGATCFIAYGSLVASLAKRIETASLLFIFTLLPLSMLGNTFLPVDQLPPIVGAISPWLPTTMMADLIRALLTTGTLPAAPLVPLAGLLLYTILFSALSMRLFRWE